MEEVAKPLCIIFQKSWQSSEVSSDWKWGDLELSFLKIKKEKGKPREQQASQSHLCALQFMEQILLEAMLRHMENKEITGDNKHSFTKSKSCLTHSVASYDEWIRECNLTGLAQSI